MTDNSAEDAADRIASALARLRGPRPPWADGRGRFGPHSHGSHEHHGHPGHPGRPGFPPGGPPWRGSDHGPLGRMAARLRVLDALATASTPLSVSELAERVGVDQPRASRLVQAGVASGHLRREADPVDARRSNVVLTDAGRAVAEQSRRARSSAVDTALAGFSDDERQQLAALLARLADAWPR